MKTFTKIIAGAGIAVAALGAVAMPANAATIPTATGDRVQGPLLIMHGSITDGRVLYNTYAPAGEGKRIPLSWFINLQDALDQATEFSLPAKGAGAGPVIDASGLCMTRPADPKDYYLTSEVCDGSPSQQFVHTASGLQHVATGWYLAQGANYPQAALDPNPGWRVYQDSLEPVDEVEVAAVTIDGPVEGSSGDSQFPTFSGTGEPGAAVVVKGDSGREICSTTVAADGTWSCASSIELPLGPIHATAEQTDADGNTTSDDVNFIIVEDDPAGPVIAPAVALGALVFAGAGVLVKRRKTARV